MLWWAISQSASQKPSRLSFLPMVEEEGELYQLKPEAHNQGRHFNSNGSLQELIFSQWSSLPAEGSGDVVRAKFSTILKKLVLKNHGWSEDDPLLELGRRSASHWIYFRLWHRQNLTEKKVQIANYFNRKRQNNNHG